MSIKPSESKVIYRILFIVYLLCLAYLCFGNLASDAKNISGWLPDAIMGIPTDKCIHFCMFFPFVLLGLPAIRKDNVWRALATIIIAAVSAAFAFEFLQDVLTDYRTTDPWDFVANITAITFSSILMAVICLIRERRV
ncbi:MAG: hypothetical protein KBT00_07785 [Bacteroidales bacterium]|nr:hypothetical protein [Candidatus Cacconaster merdequi]